MKKRFRWYLGRRSSTATRELFRARETPTPADYPEYNAVIGPFKTYAGAQFMLDFGQNNPHCRCVADAERLAKAKEF